MEVLIKLFDDLPGINGIKDIAYHEIREGRLCPVFKTDTELLGIENWKSAHMQTPVFVEHTHVLIDIMNSKKTVVIDNTKLDPRSADEFFFFKISSIMIIPVLKENAVKGIIVIASIGQLHTFSLSEVEQSEKLVNDYIYLF